MILFSICLNLYLFCKFCIFIISFTYTFSKSKMPRSRGGRGSSGGGSPKFGGGGSRSYSTGKPTTPTPFSPKPKPTNTGQPSMMKQIGATAAGVAAGNLIAAAIIGSARASIPPEVQCSEDGSCKIPNDDPCAMELKNFIECAYRAQEVQECDGYNTLLKECRRYTDRVLNKQR